MALAKTVEGSLEAMAGVNRIVAVGLEHLSWRVPVAISRRLHSGDVQKMMVGRADIQNSVGKRCRG